MEISYIRYLGVLIISGILMGLSFPYSAGIFPLIFIGLVPLIFFNVSINKVKRFRFLKHFLGNYLYMIMVNVVATWWIKNASAEGAIMAFFSNSILMSIPFFFFGFFTRVLGESKGLIGLVSAWISFELVHHHWDLSWPWLSFGNTFGNHPALIQWYEYSGILGGTLWVLLVNIIVYIIIRNVYHLKETIKIQTPLFYFLGFAVCFPIISSLVIYYTYQEKEDPVSIVVVQPNMDPWTKKFTTPVTEQLDIMLKEAEGKISQSTDFVLFPETAIASFMDEKALDYMGSIFKLRNFSAAHENLPLFIGADTYGLFEEKRPYPARKRGEKWFENYNTALVFDGDNPIDIYHKSKLVLGAEKMPFVDIFPFIGEWAVSLGGTSSILVGNSEPKVLTPSGVKCAPLICYESVYGEFVTDFTKIGAELICVITNDGWWGDTPGYKQHLTFSQIRAIENRRAVARSANTGISCFIDQKGDIIQSLDWDVQGAISSTVNKNNELTFYVRYGDLIGRIGAFLFLGVFLMSITNHFKSKKKAL